MVLYAVKKFLWIIPFLSARKGGMETVVFFIPVKKVEQTQEESGRKWGNKECMKRHNFSFQSGEKLASK